ncbi:unnamed protein product [Tilletia caries]|uniref:TRP C-terminal domain-containing protein n=1 Tax=Tilletia caries TaxID=13290 RepID=A0ABN7J891_9BASI|nr:unnamed protein product [Tilletia caries]
MTVSCFTPPLGHTNLLCVNIDDLDSESIITKHFSGEVFAARISETVSVALYLLAAIVCGTACLRVSWSRSVTVVHGRDLAAVPQDGNPILYLKLITISLLGQCITAAALGCVDLTAPRSTGADTRDAHARGLAIATVVPLSFHLLTISLFHTLVLLPASQTAHDGTSSRASTGTITKLSLFLTSIILLSKLIIPFVSDHSQDLLRALIVVQIVSYCALMLVYSFPVFSRLLDNRKRHTPGFTSFAFLLVAILGNLQAVMAVGFLTSSVQLVCVASIAGALGAVALAAWSSTIVWHYQNRQLPTQETYRDNSAITPDSDASSQRELQLLPAFAAGKRRSGRPLSSHLSALASRAIIRPRDLISRARSSEAQEHLSRTSKHGAQHKGSQKNDILLSPFSTPSSSPNPFPASPESIASSRTPFLSRKAFPFPYIRSIQRSDSSSKHTASVNKTPSPGQQWDARSPGQKERSRVAASYTGQALDYDLERGLRDESPASYWPKNSPFVRPSTAITVSSFLSSSRQEGATALRGYHGSLEQAQHAQATSAAGGHGQESVLNSSGLQHEGTKARVNSSSASLWLSFPPSGWLPTPPSSAHGTFGKKSRGSALTSFPNLFPPQSLAHSLVENGLGSPFQHQAGSDGRPDTADEPHNLSVEELNSASGHPSLSRSRAASEATMPSEMVRLASGRMEDPVTAERPMSTAHVMDVDDLLSDAHSHISSMSSSHPDATPARRSSCAFGDGTERALDFLATLDHEPIPRFCHFPSSATGTPSRRMSLPATGEGETISLSNDETDANLNQQLSLPLQRAFSVGMHGASMKADDVAMIRQALKGTRHLDANSEPWNAGPQARATASSHIRHKSNPSESETPLRDLQSSSRRTSTFGYHQRVESGSRADLHRSESMASRYSRQSSAAQSSWHGVMTQEGTEDSAGAFVRESWGLRSAAPGEEYRNFFANVDDVMAGGVQEQQAQ